MRLALFSDIHANFSALQAVLNDIDQQNVDSVYCLGDLVGYAPFANEVVAEIRRRMIPTIAGNYDWGVARNSNDCGCAYKTEQDKQMGAQSISYTNSIISDVNRAWLRNLPTHINLQFGFDKSALRLKLVHGSPRRINEYLNADRPDTSLLRLLPDAEIMCFGHTHKPYARLVANAGVESDSDAYAETDGASHKLFVNIGSVGKPKDGDSSAGYVILHIPTDPHDFDVTSVEVELRRVEYDIETTAKAIEASPLPDQYAEMLRQAY